MGTLANIPDYKLRAIFTALCTSFLLISARLVYLQIIRSNLFLHKSTNNFLRIETVHSQRGNILDTRGKLLATNRPIHNVCWRGSGNYRLTDKQKKKIFVRLMFAVVVNMTITTTRMVYVIVI